MPARFIVWGQQVTDTKKLKARELRREMTLAEQVLWKHLRGRQMHGLRFRRQQVIYGYIADFYCHPAGLVIEIDGPIHEQQIDYDEERQTIIELNDLRVLRFSNNQVFNDLDSVLAQINAAITDHRH
jgi:very-short-patch-repair endonuclease